VMVSARSRIGRVRLSSPIAARTTSRELANGACSPSIERPELSLYRNTAIEIGLLELSHWPVRLADKTCAATSL